MATKKLTVSIPAHLVDAAKRYAADAGTNLSAYITAALDGVVQQEHGRRYQQLVAANQEWSDQIDAATAAQDIADPWFARADCANLDAAEPWFAVADPGTAA